MTSIYLIRHAESLKRSTWTEPDHLRPLSTTGFRQAEALPEHLGEPAFARLLTSPYVRCVQTFEPLAEARETQLEPVDWLAEGAPASIALELLLELADEAPVAACTHGDILVDTLTYLEAARVPLEGPLESEKGSAWILDVGAGSVAGGRYLRPPGTTED